MNGRYIDTAPFTHTDSGCPIASCPIKYAAGSGTTRYRSSISGGSSGAGRGSGTASGAGRIGLILRTYPESPCQAAGVAMSGHWQPTNVHAWIPGVRLDRPQMERPAVPAL